MAKLNAVQQQQLDALTARVAALEAERTEFDAAIAEAALANDTLLAALGAKNARIAELEASAGMKRARPARPARVPTRAEQDRWDLMVAARERAMATGISVKIGG